MLFIQSGELSDQELNEKLDELSTLDTSRIYIQGVPDCPNFDFGGL